MLELINLARADGVEEATRNSLAGGLQEGPPTVAGQAWTIDDMVQPLAWNKSLKTAALAHATALNAADQFFAGGNPHSFGGTTPSDRIAAAGYVSGSYSGPTTPSGFRPGGENISERVKSPVSGYSDNELSAAVFDSHVGLFNDTTVPGRGHRNTMMLGAFKEFGVGISVGTDSSFNPGNPPPNWDSIYIVQEYGIPLAGINFVTGVVYQDLDLSLTNPSERLGYSAGEGLGGVTISAVPAGGGTALTTTTFASGGYSLQLADGTYDITASGAFGTTAAVTVIVAGANKKLDFVDPQASSGVDIVDDGAAGYSTAGSWGSWNQAGYLGDYQFGAPHIGSSATWSFDVAPGMYKIAATWRAGSNHASNAPFTILDGNTLIGSPTVDQTSVPNDFTDGQTSWETLGILPVSGTTLTVRLTGDAADNYVIADAIRIERIPDTQTLDDGDSGFANVGSWGLWDQAGHLGDYRFGASNTGSSATWSFDVAPGIYKIAATWRAGSNHASNAPFTILDGNTPIGSLTVDQTAVPNDFTDAQTSWETLGVLPISGTTLTVRLTGDAADNYVIADAIRIERIPDTQTLDDGDSGFANVGSWGLWDQAGHLGDYRFGAPDTGSSATWSFDVAPGIYKIAATWRAGSNHASNAPFTVLDGDAVVGSPTVDQTAVPNDFTDAQTSWETLGVLPILGTTLTVRLTGDAADNYVIADAIRIERIPDTQTLDDGDSGFSTVGNWGLWNQAGNLGDYRFGAPENGTSASWSFDVTPGTYKISATWRAGSNHASNAQFTIWDGDTPMGSPTVDQTSSPSDFTDGQTSWQILDTLIVSGTTLTIQLTGAAADNFVIADAVRIERIT